MAMIVMMMIGRSAIHTHHTTYRAPNMHRVQCQQFLRALPLKGAKGGNEVTCGGTLQFVELVCRHTGVQY